MSNYSKTLAAVLCWGAIQLPAHAVSVPTFSLENYQVSNTWFLPASADEASAITYNWDTDTLFVLGDEGDALVEISKSGQQLSVMSLSSFDDTEGLAYVGSGQFVITEERIRDAYKLTYNPGQTVNRNGLPSADLGTTVGNIGVEGIAYDQRDGSFITVKEKSPQQVLHNQLTFGAPGNATITTLFSPALDVLDLSDVQILGNISMFTGTATADHLLLFSQESSRLLEVDRAGNIISALDFSAFSDSAEGVALDAWGTIFLVDENDSAPRLFELTAVPLPAAAWLFGSGLVLLFGAARRSRRR